MDIRYIIPDHRIRLVMSNHKHHIVPKYKCKELGLTTSYKIDGTEFYFKENMVEVTREQHALIHWGYWCNDLSPLLEICNPPQWVINMIPLEDVRDSGAAGVIALGEIEQIDISGENNPNFKDGRLTGWRKNKDLRKPWTKDYYQINKEKIDNRQKDYRNNPETRHIRLATQKRYRDKKKVERQGQGTLEQFIE